MSNSAQLQDEETYSIIGACLTVHRVLGPGFLEAVYQEALALAFARAGIPFATEVPFYITFMGRQLKTTYRADFVCYGRVVVEIKALTAVTTGEKAQVINYLKASGLHRGLLINFGARSLQYHRFVS
jgi:GxxExxY protein